PALSIAERRGEPAGGPGVGATRWLWPGRRLSPLLVDGGSTPGAHRSSLRGRAAGGGHRARADGEPEGAPPRRAVAGAGAHHGAPDLRRPPGAGRKGHGRPPRGAGRHPGAADREPVSMPARGSHHAGGQTGRCDHGEDRSRLFRSGRPIRSRERRVNWANAIVQGVLLGGLYALFACGLSLLFGVVRVVNLAHGDFAVLAAYLALVVITTTHVPALLTFVIVAPLFALFGYGVQRLIIQKSLEVSPLTTLLVTFGLSVVIQNLLLVIASADSHSFDLGSLISASLRVSPELSIGY